MSAFWSFTLEVYGRQGVQPSVIHLQDDRGVDVNLLLYAMWTASLGLPAFDKARAQGLADAVEAWRETAIEPLRAVRTALRGGVAHAPEDETEAERVEQVIIETETPDAEGREAGTASPDDVAANLASVMALNDAPLSSANRDALRAIVMAACPGANATAVDQAMEIRLS
ncbi:MAG: TIGR02444 family protein [Alphaproteobacteria bacterium]